VPFISNSIPIAFRKLHLTKKKEKRKACVTEKSPEIDANIMIIFLVILKENMLAKLSKTHLKKLRAEEDTEGGEKHAV
jgi:hypothetical protein